MRIDTAVHIWSRDQLSYPYAPLDGSALPPGPHDAEELVKSLTDVGFDGAVCIQSRAYGYDHAYLITALRRWPDRFAGVCLVNPVRPTAPAQLRSLVTEYGMSGVRLLPYCLDEVPWLAGAEGDPLWAEAGELGVPVDVLVVPGQLPELYGRARRNPGVTVVIDHFGMTTPADDSRPLLRCAELPNTVVKMSAVAHLSGDPFPYRNMHALARSVVDAWGPDRVVFGTDWPYDMALDWPVSWILAMESLTQAEKEAILWRNLERLLKL